MQKPNDVRVTIAPQAIIAILLSIFGVWLVYQLREIVVLLLIILAIAVAFSPIIKAWEKFIPRTVAIALLYVLVVVVVLAAVALLLPPLINQFSDFLTYVQSQLSNGSPASDAYLERFKTNIDLLVHGEGLQAIGDILGQFQGSLGAVLNTTAGFIGGAIAVITVFITSFYLLLEEQNMERFLGSLAPASQRKRIEKIFDKISVKMGGWLRGQLILMGIIGTVNAIGLAIIGVPYPLLLGLWSGLTESLPIVGPILGAAPGVILAFATLGWIKGLIVLALYLVVQQIENHFLVPKIMGKVLGLSPLTIIFSLLIGGKLLGLIGVMIAVPIAAAISVIFEEWREAN